MRAERERERKREREREREVERERELLESLPVPICPLGTQEDSLSGTYSHRALTATAKLNIYLAAK